MDGGAVVQLAVKHAMEALVSMHVACGEEAMDMTGCVGVAFLARGREGTQSYATPAVKAPTA